LDGDLRKEIAISDDGTKKGQQDRNRIDVHEDYELRYWTRNSV
jgi:uncharacterized protein DUF3606